MISIFMTMIKPELTLFRFKQKFCLWIPRNFESLPSECVLCLAAL